MISFKINQASNLFDLSQLYGSTIEKTESLREFNDGRLKVSGSEDNTVLTYENDNTKYCLLHANSTNICYKSGDTRVNVNPYVTIFHIIFLRNHNRYAKIIKEKNSNWNDEKIFNEARKLNIATYQKIIFEEWSKEILGPIPSSVINNEPIKNNNNNEVSNEFAIAAIKFYNSMMPGDLNVASQSNIQDNIVEAYLKRLSFNIDLFIFLVIIIFFIYCRVEIIKLQNVFYRPINFGRTNQLERIIEATLKQKSMAMDSSIVDDLSMELYRCNHPGFNQFGTDALALDIMRGRDHGLAPYYKYVSQCLHKSIYHWNDLIGILKSDDLLRLKMIYNSVEDVDLIMGLISEIPAHDATVGPTTVCIIGKLIVFFI